MSHENDRSQKRQKCLKRVVQDSLLSNRFSEFECKRNQVKNEVKLGDGFKDSSEFEKYFLEAVESGMNYLRAYATWTLIKWNLPVSFIQ